MSAEPRHYAALDLVRFERGGSGGDRDLAPAATARHAEVAPEYGPKPAVAIAATASVQSGSAASAPAAPATVVSAPTPVANSTPPPAAVPARGANRIAAPADPELAARIAQMDWSTLRAELRRRRRPPATQGVFGVGCEDAPLFVIGEAPGAEEDRSGEPFVGRAGKLLDAMLGAIQCDRQRNVYIANICKFRPPDNRDPRPEEIAEDFPLLLRQIALVRPTLLLAVGRIAAQTLLESTTPIGKMRSRVHQHPATGLPLVVTYHPAYLLRSPMQKARAWDDLKLVRGMLADNPPAPG